MLYYSWTTKSIEQEMNIESFKEESFTYKAIILGGYLELQHIFSRNITNNLDVLT